MIYNEILYNEEQSIRSYPECTNNQKHEVWTVEMLKEILTQYVVIQYPKCCRGSNIWGIIVGIIVT